VNSALISTSACSAYLYDFCVVLSSGIFNAEITDDAEYAEKGCSN
jgi:hypothetical protein